MNQALLRHRWPSDGDIEQFGSILDDSKEIFVRLCNVASNEARHLVLVLSHQTFVDFPMIFKVEAGPLRIQKVDPALDDQLFSDILKNLSQGHILACLVQKLVEMEALDGIGGQITLRQRMLTMVQIGAEVGQIVLRPILQGEECSRDLQ